MKLPYFKFWDVTPVVVTITSGVTEDGLPKEVVSYEGKCNFDTKSKYAQNSDGTWIRLAGILTIGKDIAPDFVVVEGYVTLGSITCKIFGGSKPLNPDGTVNHTKLELI